MRLPMPISNFVRLFLCGLLGAAGWSARAAVSYSVGVPIVTNYVAPGYVIDSDATRGNTNYFRHLLPVRLPVTVVKTGSSPESSATMAVRFRLRNLTTGQFHPLQGGTNTIVTAPQSAFFLAPGTNTLNFNTNLVPTTRLDPFASYRVEGEVFQTSNGSLIGTNQSVDRTFIHFRGPWGTDVPVNVVAALNSVTPVRRWLVDTDPTNNTFLADVNFTLHRYDNPTVAATSDPILVRMLVELVERDTQTPVALATNLFVLDPAPTLASYLPAGGGQLQRPATNTLTRTLAFRPAPGVQMDSVNFVYRARVTISHIEQFDPFVPVILTGNQATHLSLRHLHFNGRLDFGNVPTTIRAVTNTPTTGVAQVGNELHTTLGLALGGATLDAHSGYSAGPGLINIGLLTNGNAYCRAPSSLPVSPSSTPFVSLNGVNYQRSNLSLDSAGAKAGGIEVILPAGLGWAEASTSRQQNGSFTVDGPHVLDAQLQPTADLTFINNPSGAIWVAEETKPVTVRVSQITWRRAEGRFDMPTGAPDQVQHVRTPHYNALQAAPVPLALKTKPSNDGYWRAVAGVGAMLEARAASDGGAELTGEFTLGPTNGLALVAHFPERAVLVLSNGFLRVVNDRVIPADSFLNVSPIQSAVAVPMLADCQSPACGTTPGTNAFLFPDDRQLRFTTDGGLTGGGDLATPFPLRWGWIPSLSRHAHRTDPFSRGSVHIPGHFLPGNYSLLPATPAVNRRPAVILLSGANPDTGVVTERPRQPGYYQGFADYAGMNFRAGPSNSIAPSGLEGESTLGGGVYGPYDLKGRSKYYVRRGGVSGIHDKVQTAPALVVINGYQFTFLNFGLAFLLNENVDSRTEGSLFLPYPTDATLNFEKLLFLCNGALDKADVQNGPQAILARYWEAPLDVSTIEFTRDPAQLCNPGNGFLALGVDAYMAHVSDSFQGKLGVFPHGNFIPRNGGPTNLDSRLITPSQVSIRGPRRAAPGASGFETYTVTPTVGAFFNTLGSAPNYVHPGSPPAAPLDKGFLNLPGLVKVAFFEPLPAHLQTASHRPPVNPDNPGAWGSAELFLANGTWSGKSFFGTGYHDPDNRGFSGTTAANLSNYRTNAQYFTRAKQEWLGGAIEFDFPVKWNSPTRSFRSLTPIKEDFVVVNTERRVAYLSAERAEVRFGAQVGLPQLNLANFVVNELTEATGMAAVVSNAIGGAVVGGLSTGLDRLGDVLKDHLREHYERVLGSSLDTMANQIHAHLLTQWTGTGWVGGTPPQLTNFFSGATPQIEATVWSKLGGGPGSQIAELTSALNQAINAIDLFIGPNGLLRSDGSGGVDVAVARTLARALVQELAGDVNNNLAAVVGNLAAAELDALLAPHLADAQPTLADLRGVFVELRASLLQVRNSLTSGPLGNELSAILANALNSEFPAVNEQIRQNIRNYLGTFNANNRFNLASPTVVKAKLRKTIADQFHGTAYVASVQGAVKHRLYDLNAAFISALDTTFGQVNEVVKGGLTSILLELDTGFQDVLGLFSAFMSSAGLDGYAIFNGDALRKVRLDAKFRWKVPEDTTFSAFLEINQYESGSDESPCGPLGKDTAEVILGALNVPFDFLSPDLRADIHTKFSFDVNPNGSLQPIGFAGSVQKTAGEVSFEAFSITDLAVAVAFGERENYLSAALGLRFNSYKAKGGIFFGRTCTLQPIMMWDLFVASALGQPNPTFTGAYVYGEAHIPVSEAILGIPATCFFEVNAGMGLGIFYFVEGPTYGARGKLAVSGSALCMLSLSGELNMTGLKQGSKFKLKGAGTVAVEIGVCPLCIEASRTVNISAETGGGKSKGGQPSVK